MNIVALVLAGVLLAVIGLTRAAGASLVRTSRADALRDHTEGIGGAGTVARLLEDRARIQPALGALHTLLLVLAAIPAAWAVSVTYRGAALVGALAVVGVTLVFLGDLLPRGIGRRRPRHLAYRLAWWLRPAVAFGLAASDLVNDDEDEEDEEPSDDPVADAGERELIESVIDFTDTIVREVMTPRTDMVVVAADDSIAAARQTVIEQGRSRIPVVGKGADDVLGMLYARDLLGIREDFAGTCRDIMRPASLVPETKRVAELLRDMQEGQIHMAIVVDEFGGTAGLVTIEDLLEELVGEIADEYDDEEPMVTALEGGGYLLDGRLGIDELATLLGVDVPDEEWDTVGGLVLGLAGRVPDEGESFEFDDHLLVADRVAGRRIERVLLRPQP